MEIRLTNVSPELLVQIRREGEGHWGGNTSREWIPNKWPPFEPQPCSNPNHDPTATPEWYLGGKGGNK